MRAKTAPEAFVSVIVYDGGFIRIGGRDISEAFPCGVDGLKAPDPSCEAQMGSGQSEKAG